MNNNQHKSHVWLRRYGVGIAAMLAPLCFLVGWAILMQRAGSGPDTGWFVSHALLLTGAVLSIPAVIGLHALLSKDMALWADAGVGAALIGSAALVGQFAIDLAIGLISSNQAEMSSHLRQISSTPGIALPFHLAGPLAYYGGLMILIVLLMRGREISRWLGILTLLGIVGVGTQAVSGLAFLALLGFTGMSGGLGTIGWAILKRERDR